jgi:hypothetical protein
MAHEHIQDETMTESELSKIRTRIHEQRCTCYFLSATILQLAESMESQSAEQARPFYGMAAILSAVSENLEQILIELEPEL